MSLVSKRIVTFWATIVLDCEESSALRAINVCSPIVPAKLVGFQRFKQFLTMSYFAAAMSIFETQGLGKTLD